jgi:hypothetical protein
MSTRISAVWSTALLVISCAGGSPSAPEVISESDQHLRNLEYRDVAREDFEEYCEAAACRGPLTIRLVRDNGTVFESFYDLWPPFADENGNVNILPGETVHLMADVIDGRIANLRLSPSGLPPVRGIEFAFWQDTTMRAGNDMFLQVQSTFEKPVKFDLGVMTLNSDEIAYTSSCPVLPGKRVIEHWSYTIFQLFIARFRFLEESAEYVCE